MNTFQQLAQLILGRHAAAPVPPPAPVPPMSDSEINALIKDMWQPEDERGYVDEGGWIL